VTLEGAVRQYGRLS